MPSKILILTTVLDQALKLKIKHLEAVQLPFPRTRLLVTSSLDSGIELKGPYVYLQRDLSVQYVNFASLALPRVSANKVGFGNSISCS